MGPSCSNIWVEKWMQRLNSNYWSLDFGYHTAGQSMTLFSFIRFIHSWQCHGHWLLSWIFIHSICSILILISCTFLWQNVAIKQNNKHWCCYDLVKKKKKKVYVLWIINLYTLTYKEMLTIENPVRDELYTCSTTSEVFWKPEKIISFYFPHMSPANMQRFLSLCTTR